MYDKSIAGEQRNYSITITTNATTIYDLLGTNDKAEVDAILSAGLPVQGMEQYPSKNTQSRVRCPVDGYVVSSAGEFQAGTSASSALETVPINTQYVCPVFFWLTKTWVVASGPTVATVRVFFS